MKKKNKRQAVRHPRLPCCCGCETLTTRQKRVVPLHLIPDFEAGWADAEWQPLIKNHVPEGAAPYRLISSLTTRWT